MLTETILAHPAEHLTEDERRHYFAQGYVALAGAIPSAWTEKLRAATRELVERSRQCTSSDEMFELEAGHSASTPRLHRVYSPQDRHPAFWEFICSEEMTALAADVVGPDVKFHHAKLNLKSARGSRGFAWHQDIQAWPHTDYSPVTVGVYIDGCDADQGPLAMIRGSHLGKLYSLYDEDGGFAVRIAPDEMTWLEDEMVDAPTGPAGTAVLLGCRTIHGSLRNQSDRDRPLLLVVYSSADSFAYPPVRSRVRVGEIVLVSRRDLRVSTRGVANCRRTGRVKATAVHGGGSGRPSRRQSRSRAGHRRGPASLPGGIHPDSGTLWPDINGACVRSVRTRTGATHAVAGTDRIQAACGTARSVRQSSPSA